MATKLYYKDGSSQTEIPFLPSQTGKSGKFLKTDGTNASWESLSIPGSPYVVQTETADGATTSWTLDSFNGLQVFLDGLLCLEGSGYSVSGNTVTFDSAPAANTKVTFYKYNGIRTGYAMTRESQEVTTAGNTFTVAATLSALLVYLDGLLCEPTTTYSVSGQTVTFVDTIPAGSVVSFVSFK